jgi:hypothetical protein
MSWTDVHLKFKLHDARKATPQLLRHQRRGTSETGEWTSGLRINDTKPAIRGEKKGTLLAPVRFKDNSAKIVQEYLW